jgi:hypothetical protein
MLQSFFQGTIQAHLLENNKLEFHKYIKIPMSDDLKRVIGIIWFGLPP